MERSCRSPVKGELEWSNLSYLGAGVDQQPAQQRSMAARFVLAIATHGKFGLPRQQREGGNESLGRRLTHLAPVAALERRPPRVGPRLGRCPRQDRCRRRQI